MSDWGVVPDGVEVCPDCGERQDNCMKKSPDPRHCWRWYDEDHQGAINAPAWLMEEMNQESAAALGDRGEA